ncbi:2-dehydropantoate 2-reductase [Amycolatopsis anabasis]|uniref:2-dehydropantoate 2-reductase n=1 Tax=Amycolatopsis anabasis TaxID=1840409 RepID=UPI00131E7635|nr:2-dehydropantoate 2-reductase [Amycolatopsis anabasis]
MTSVAIIGAGAIGTVLAAAVHRTGADTVLCTRTPVGELVLADDDGEHAVDVPVRTDPATAAPVDWVLLTTKGQDVAGAAPWLSRLRAPETTVVALQNGVEHRERVTPLAGSARVLPALVYIAAERIAAGRVRHRRGRRIVVPENADASAFAALLAGSGLEVHREPDFTTAAWRKLLGNVAANPITALTLRRLEVLRDGEIGELTRTLLTEAIAVGAACGARLDAADLRRTLDFYREFAADDGTSMLYDRLAGRPPETDLINGAIVRFGREHGVPTPANQAVHALLAALQPERADLAS